MNKDFKTPPISICKLTPPGKLVKHLSELVGTTFLLTRKTRTDGSKIKNIIAATLEKYPLPELAETGQYEIVPPKGKGMPKIKREFNITTYDVRYLIALTNPQTEIIEGVILVPGKKLGELFSYVSNESYKCQRSIPMAFFEKYYGQSVFNPD